MKEQNDQNELNDQNSEVVTLTDAFRTILEVKDEYARKLGKQLDKRVRKGCVSKITAQQHILALNNLASARTKFEQQEFAEAMHFFSRACANLGSLVGRAELEQKQS